MSLPVLSTKLYIPPLRSKVVVRPQLQARLNEGVRQDGDFVPNWGFERKLTLVSAPAGYGKTTLVREWIASGEWPVAWLSLDEGDNEANRFLMYLVAALQTILATVGEGVLNLIQTSRPPSYEALLTLLLNDIAAIPDDFVLVLDDYHVIDTQMVDDALTFLIEHQPPQMHVVIITREDPALPLARLRVQGQLTELRATDLRFTPAESAEFLTQMMGLNLSAGDIAALEMRTEGWIAGLQLAAISIQGHHDAPRFIKSFTGSHRFVMDYLIEEVLHQLSEQVQMFLLSTSILDRLSGSLCDAVLGDAAVSGQATLEYIERANLLIVPLDDQRQWYRYHHLFADALRTRLMNDHPHLSSTLHRRASEWYEQRGLRADAVRHALAAADFDQAATLIELVWPEMRRMEYQSSTWVGWVETLPEDVIRSRPVLHAGYAWTLLTRARVEEGEAHLKDIEQWLANPTTDAVYADEAEFKLLPATVATGRALYAQATGDVQSVIKYAECALDLLPLDDYFQRAIPTALMGLAYWTGGDLTLASQAFTESIANMQREGNILHAIGGVTFLATIKVAQGHFREAVRVYQQSLELATEHGAAAFPGMVDLYLGLSELHLEQNELELATQNIMKSEEINKQVALEAFQYRWRVVRARLKEIQGDLAGALNLLDEAERLHTGRIIPTMHPVAAMKARIWVAQGRLTDALAWVSDRGLSVDDDLSYRHEFEHLTLVRVLIAKHKSGQRDSSLQDALYLVERLLHAAQAGDRTGSVIEVLGQRALAYAAQDDLPAALEALERALTLAEPEGYVRLFVDEGPPMRDLLAEAYALGVTPNYVNQLLTAFEADVAQPADRSDLLSIEPLSQRELEVLHLIARGLSNQAISEQLFVTLNTIKGHNKKIFGKLGVQRRTEAVARARELGLL